MYFLLKVIIILALLFCLFAAVGCQNQSHQPATIQWHYLPPIHPTAQIDNRCNYNMQEWGK